MTREKLIEHIANIYGVDAEYPWESAPKFAVFRHQNNRKWFAVIMDLSKQKLGFDSDAMIDVLNLKCDPILIGNLRNENGFYPAYHMNKTYWITVALDGSVEDEIIKWLVDLSFDLTDKKKKQ